MTVLPPINGHASEIIEAVQYQHNWLYSVVPAKLVGDSSIGIYLAGYCKVCRHGFSVPIPFGIEYVEENLGIPRFGCVSELAGL